MNRRWFLGAIGSIVGIAVAPKVGQLMQVQNPEIITAGGAQLLLHTQGFEPPQGAAGFAQGCIWQQLDKNRAYVNTGTKDCAHWISPHGDPNKFVRMVLRQRALSMDWCVGDKLL